MYKKTNKLLMAATLTTVSAAHAMTPLTDADLSDVTGQSFIEIDSFVHNQTEFTRIGLGARIELQATAQKLSLGEYNGGADIDIDNFSLGYIENHAFYSANPSAVRQYKDIGSKTPYGDGEIVPFTIENPFLEFAYDLVTNEIVGIRLSFGEAMGMLSGQINALSGNVDVKITATGDQLVHAQKVPDYDSAWDNLIFSVAQAALNDNPVQADAYLVDPATGNPNNYRATHIGLPDGHALTFYDVGWLLYQSRLIHSSLTGSTESCGLFCTTYNLHAVSQDCQVLGRITCFELRNYNSLPIGQISGSGNNRYLSGPADGLFLSFQTKAVEYLHNIPAHQGGANPDSNRVLAAAGGFLNIPTGGIEINLQDAFGGLPMRRLEHINRAHTSGINLF